MCPDGSPDKNVFDIQAGVSINLFIKTGKKKKGILGKVKHIDIWGSRESKYNVLLESNFKSIDFKEVKYEKPYYFFMPKNNEGQSEYEKGFSVNELFPNNVTGIVTMGDAYIVAEIKEKLKSRLIDFKQSNINAEELTKEYRLGKNYAKWLISNKEKIIIEDNNFTKISYRPFDDRWTYFDNKVVWRWREKTMRHFLAGENLGLALCKQFKTGNQYVHSFITNKIIESSYVSNRTSEITSTFPLYLYPEQTTQQNTDDQLERVPNLDKSILDKFSKALGLTFSAEKSNKKAEFAPIDILDYIYAVLYSPAYREKYKEFLKIDFPKVPYPDYSKDINEFWRLVSLGGQLRRLHLLESETVKILITKYPISGNHSVEKIIYKEGKVWINASQYFEDVPKCAWDFYIGGYQPAQKWLKDRKGRQLNNDEIRHYQKIIVALFETHKLMLEIDKVNI